MAEQESQSKKTGRRTKGEKRTETNMRKKIQALEEERMHERRTKKEVDKKRNCVENRKIEGKTHEKSDGMDEGK